MSEPKSKGEKVLSGNGQLFFDPMDADNTDELWLEWQDSAKDPGDDNLISEEIVSFVCRHLGIKEHKLKPGSLLCRAAAVLVVLGAISVVLAYCLRQKKNMGIYVKNVTVEQKAHEVVEKENNGRANKSYLLPDHSEVVLHPSSCIKYDMSQFTEASSLKRDIYLTGSARFKVAKNHRKPFTVYSGNLLTTALGTEFDVLKNSGNTTVKLYRGKVVVRSLKQQKGWEKDVYLLPGEMVALNDAVPQKIRVWPVTLTTSNKRAVVSKKAHDDKMALLPMQCDNMPLNEVLGTLEHFYQVRIVYDAALLKDKYFSGEILQEKSPETILRIICNMQNLQMEKTNAGYIIHK